MKVELLQLVLGLTKEALVEVPDILVSLNVLCELSDEHWEQTNSKKCRLRYHKIKIPCLPSVITLLWNRLPSLSVWEVRRKATYVPFSLGSVSKKMLEQTMIIYEKILDMLFIFLCSHLTINTINSGCGASFFRHCNDGKYCLLWK